MRFGSALAIYVLFWTMCLFVVLPMGMRTAEEEGSRAAPGHAESAPHHFSLGRTALRTTLLSAILFGLFYANYIYGWITPSMLDWTD